MSQAQHRTNLSRRRFLTGTAVALTGLAGLAATGRAAHAKRPTIQVYKSPSCGCCTEWVTYMEEHGWTASVTDMPDVTPIKRQAGIPESLYACHTAIVDGYVVEGHVPAAAIEQLLAERPDLSGIAVAGMPMDSPGMRGGGVQDVTGFKSGDVTGRYTRVR